MRHAESGNRLQGPPRRESFERLAGRAEHGGLARSGLKAPADHIDVQRIEFDAATDAAVRLALTWVAPEPSCPSEENDSR